MASKRMKNRVYWAHVKAQTYAFNLDGKTVTNLRNAYRALFVNCQTQISDTRITNAYEDDLLAVEEKYGPAGLRNVHNRDLWPVRERLAMALHDREKHAKEAELTPR